MAKELPYFKFEPAEYLTKDISFCSLSAQGLFTNICCYYWQRNCKLTKDQLLKRLNYETELNELISEGVIDLKDNNIVIKFLDLQLNEVIKTSNRNSINGSKGGRPKKTKQKQLETEKKPTALISLSEKKGIREDNIILDEIIKDNNDVEKENTFHDIDKLKKHYLSKEKVLKAVVNDKRNKVKDLQDLKNKLDLHCDDLIQQGRNSEKWLEFTRYFINSLRSGKFENKINQSNEMTEEQKMNHIRNKISF